MAVGLRGLSTDQWLRLERLHALPAVLVRGLMDWSIVFLVQTVWKREM